MRRRRGRRAPAWALPLLLSAALCSGARAEPPVAEVTQLLSEMVRIDTTNPPGRELPAAEHLAAWLEARGVHARVILSAPGRGNVVARLPADAPVTGGPILLLSHLDVVPADPEAWSFPPFSGAIRGGFVYGRGSLDDKGQGAVFAAAVTALAHQDAPRHRDIVLCASADEEVDGSGVRFLIRNHWKLLGPPAVVWNEGGGSSQLSELGGVVVNGISNTEKRALWLTVEARGVGGHGSQPERYGATDRLVRALARLHAWQTPLRITPSVDEQFRRIAASQPFPTSFGLRHLDNPLALRLAGGFLTRSRLTNAMVRDTVALTGLHAGLKPNVIPRRATASLDVRLLPDTDARAFVAQMEAIISDPDVRIVLPESGLPPKVEASPVDRPLFRAIEAEMEREVPGSITVPFQATGATDSLFFRERGVPAYGFFPALLSPDLNASVHGLDERIPVDELMRAVRVTTAVLRRLTTEGAGSPPAAASR